MGNLSFNKNNFISNQPAKLVNPINNDPTKLGRRTIEEINDQMHNKMEREKPKAIKDIQFENMNSLKTFKEWNKK